MSSDYRPRGGSSSGSTGSGSGGGPRRRRGGRNRGGAGRSHPGETRSSYSNGTNGATSTPAKKEGPIAKLFGWLTGKKKAAPAKSDGPVHRAAPRSEFRDKPREPRAPRADSPPRDDKPREDPVPQEIVSPKLYVGNLAYEAVESDLYDLFSKVGEVKNVEIAMDRHANRSKGFGFVEMASLETAKEAAAKYNRTDFMARQIVVSGAKLERRSVNKRDDEPMSEERTGADETSD